MLPIISVIMPCRNAAGTIEHAIQSVLSQTFRDFELLVVDDNSSDASQEVISKYALIDDRVKMLVNGSQNGVAVARNLALVSSRGKYVAFLDADDIWLPSSLEMRIQCIRETGCLIVFGSYLKNFDNSTTRLVRPPKIIRYPDMLVRNHIGNLTGMYDRSALGIHLQRSVGHEDYLMWCELVRTAGCAISAGDSPLGEYRVSSSSLSGNKLKAAWWHWCILRNQLKIRLSSALYFQARYAASSIFSWLGFK